MRSTVLFLLILISPLAKATHENKEEKRHESTRRKEDPSEGATEKTLDVLIFSNDEEKAEKALEAWSKTVLSERLKAIRNLRKRCETDLKPNLELNKLSRISRFLDEEVDKHIPSSRIDGIDPKATSHESSYERRFRVITYKEVLTQFGSDLTFFQIDALDGRIDSK